MEYFDTRKLFEVIVDASPTGLGAILTQDGGVISYASKALSDVESRYTQTEREMLAIVWGIEHFHLYVYGSIFTVRTDHKPLLGIFKGSKPASARIERWRLQLTPYGLDLVYKPGCDDNNPADFLSRHPSTISKPDRSTAEDYVHCVCVNTVPRAMSLSELRDATAQDSTMIKLQEAIRSQRWDDELVRLYKQIRSKFASHDGLILRGTRIVIPEALQQQVVNLAHIGHQGIVKTKRLLWEKVWFPGIDRLVERRIHLCILCQATLRKSTNPEPLKMSSLPPAP